VVFFSSTKSVH